MAAAATAGIVADGCALASYLRGGGLPTLTTQQGGGSLLLSICSDCTLVLFLSNRKLICQCQLSWRMRGAPGSCPSWSGWRSGGWSGWGAPAAPPLAEAAAHCLLSGCFRWQLPGGVKQNKPMGAGRQ